MASDGGKGYKGYVKTVFPYPFITLLTFLLAFNILC